MLQDGKDSPLKVSYRRPAGLWCLKVAYQGELAMPRHSESGL